MPTAKQRCKDIRDRFYPFEGRPAEILWRRILSLADPDAVVIEVGCGREPGLLRRAVSHFGSAYGFDPEFSAPLQEGRIHLARGFAEHLSLPDESADLIITVDVLEHLAEPVKAFSEFARVLRSRGRILSLTPNILHPPLLLARPLPHWMRRYLNKRATGTESEDTFPTFYRANTVGALRHVGQNSGLSVVSIEHISNHPQYLMFSRLCYRAGIAIERNILNTRPFAFLRHYILSEFEKPETTSKVFPERTGPNMDRAVEKTRAVHGSKATIGTGETASITKIKA